MIVGEINEKGEKDPYKLTFVYKTGISNKIEAKKQERLKLGKTMKDNVKKLCSHVRDEVEELYSSCVADTCGGGMSIFQTLCGPNISRWS